MWWKSGLNLEFPLLLKDSHIVQWLYRSAKTQTTWTKPVRNSFDVQQKIQSECPSKWSVQNKMTSFVGEQLAIKSKKVFNRNLMKHWLMPALSVVRRKTSPQAKCHKLSLLSTSLTIFTSLTFSLLWLFSPLFLLSPEPHQSGQCEQLVSQLQTSLL